MTFLLVHGAWHGAWCWDTLIETLERRGHAAVAIDLPGAEPGGKPGWGIKFADYIDAVNRAAEQIDGDVHLVGHSMGGLSISGAAEARPELYSSLTYVTAFLVNGRNIIDVTKKDYDAPLFRKAMKVPNPLRGRAEVKPELAPGVFYNNCSDDVAAAASAQLCPLPSRPSLGKSTLTEARWGSIPRYYVFCTQDNALPLANQRAFVEELPCADTVTLDTDHSPFMSTPDQLADALIGFASKEI